MPPFFTVKTKNFNLQEDSYSSANELLKLMQDLNIQGIEPLISEDAVLQDIYNKYDILAVLRNIFLEYKKLGDQEISIREGGCGSTCQLNGAPVYELYGHQSERTFAFVIREENSQIVNIHPCMSYVDKDGEKGKNGWEMFLHAAKTLLDRKKPNE
ncbi:MAG: hypothetical protein AAGI23_01205 [Bacteroidota bacterium]